MLHLTDSHVYKLKKPVDFGFLDYSSVANRCAACESKLTLNRRLAPDVYLDVVPVGVAATVVGLIPLLVAADGPGAASRFAISFTLRIGMAIGTVFTLFFVPALYRSRSEHRHRKR